jgi:hypothetical protein
VWRRLVAKTVDPNQPNPVVAATDRLALLYHRGITIDARAAVPLMSLESYLLARDWKVVEHPNSRAVVLQHSTFKYQDGSPAEIVLPAEASYDGARIQMDIAITTIAAFSNLTIQEVAAEVMGLPTNYFSDGWRKDITTISSSAMAWWVK